MILEEVKSAFNENKLAIYVSIAILFISLVLGYFLEPHLYGYFNPVVEDLTHKVQQGTIKLTFQSIFLNNIKIVFTMFIFGVTCFFSGVILGFNGFFAGYYVATTDDMLVTMLLIVPHGIFEFSSCILACASGFVLFNFLFKFLKTLNRQDNGPVKELLLNSFDASSDKLKQAITLLIIASILMAIAGFVEVYLTLPIAEFLYSFLT
ncbi:stage II sporulation protein M [Methanobrevibacter sp.]|uniref:stage II sporulation protein M n=1 Tax=Methanobrevibacter sp. TaxID=66852 RepID=UPI002E7960D0|nr:stage II sporulation protein M [Methanobrevibacter sp.]MEE1336746.1 stage II sporulation protein M [Methanobrevibacter sp.]